MMMHTQSPIGRNAPFALFRHLSTVVAPIVACLLLWAPVGHGQTGDQHTPGVVPTTHTITIDGRFDDWSGMEPNGLDIHTPPSENDTKKAVLDLGQVWITHDDAWLYIHWENGRAVNIQGLDGPLSIRLNVDGDDSTGIILPLNLAANPNTKALAGIDIDLRFSPRDKKRGTYATAYFSENDPIGTTINPYRFNAAFAPTYASNHVEMRLRRGVMESKHNQSSDQIALFMGSTVCVQLVAFDPSGTIIDHTPVITHSLTPMPVVAIEPVEIGHVPVDQPATEIIPEPVIEENTETESVATSESAIKEITGGTETESTQADPGESQVVTDDPDDASIIETTRQPEPVVESSPIPSPKKPAFTLDKNPSKTKVRFVSWNVERGYIFKNPDPFARVLDALDPDVICFQELGYDATANELANWLNQHVPGRTQRGYDWDVTIMNDTGTGIATRLANTPIGPKQMPATSDDGKRRLRATTLLVGGSGPFDDRRIAVVSTHLKCCGRAGDRADDRRVQEADHIHRILRGIRYDANPSAIVIMGDFNLVGSRRPLEAMMIDDDFDASDLLDVAPIVLGDRINTTWRDPNQPFLPGRLDFTLISDSSLNVSNSFLLDTELLDSNTLTFYNLRSDDTTKASDHLPSVVDLSW